jgi:RNA polymerase sigma factor (sigma-70 family)
VPDSEVVSGQDVAVLVRAAAAGDQQAWNALVERFSGLLWSIARSYRVSSADAADAVQLTWLRLVENLDRVQDPARLSGWLATTCRRECLAVLRRERRVRPAEDGVLEWWSGPEPSADRASLSADVHAAVRRAFSLLGERCQRVLRVLVAAVEDGRPSYQLASAALDMPVGSLGPTRARCLEQLRQLLAEAGVSDPLTDS